MSHISHTFYDLLLNCTKHQQRGETHSLVLAPTFIKMLFWCHNKDDPHKKMPRIDIHDEHHQGIDNHDEDNHEKDNHDNDNQYKDNHNKDFFGLLLFMQIEKKSPV